MFPLINNQRLYLQTVANLASKFDSVPGVEGERAQTSRAGPGRQVRLRSYDITKIISELNKLNNGGEADAGAAKPSARAQQEGKLQTSLVLNCSALHSTEVCLQERRATREELCRTTASFSAGTEATNTASRAAGTSTAN